DRLSRRAVARPPAARCRHAVDNIANGRGQCVARECDGASMAAPAAGDGNIAALAGLESGPISTRSAARRGKPGRRGEVAEWLKAHAWNACIRETVSRVRIPLSPPLSCSEPEM